METSIYQKKILAGVVSQYYAVKKEQEINQSYKEAMIINAFAGSGKSFTSTLIAEVLKDGLKLKPEQILFSAFTKKNKEDLNIKLIKKLGTEWELTKTLNSASFQVLRTASRVNRWKLDSYKYNNISEELGYTSRYDKGQLVKRRMILDDKDFINLIDYLRLFYYSPDPYNVEELNAMYNLGINDASAVAMCARNVLDRGYKLAEKENIIDFTDQMWIPLMKVYKENNEKYLSSFNHHSKEVILIDEAQDSDWSQMLITKLLCKSLVIATGDERQSVYNFRGCLSNGMEKWNDIVNRSISYDLPINYRCPKSHIELVRASFPSIDIIAHDEAIKGEINVIPFKDLTSVFKNKEDSYLVVARKNASLILGALTSLANDIPVKIKDVNLGNRILNEVKKIYQVLDDRYSYSTFLEDVEEYKVLMRQQYSKSQDFDRLCTNLDDICEALTLLYNAYQPKTQKDWKEKVVQKIFDNSDYNYPIQFTTIHSGKGGEADHAVVLFPEDLPLIYKGITQDQMKQEYNLAYVAITRGMKSLTFVTRNKQKVLPSWINMKQLIGSVSG